MKRALPAAVLVAFVTASAVWLGVQVAPLSALVRGGEPPPTLVLLHGYGSSAEDWLQFEDALEVPNNGRLILLQGMLRNPLSGSRGWWWLNLEGHVPPGERLPDYSASTPNGIKLASRRVREYLEKVQGPVILGGFSQGAMLSGEIAFQTDQALAGLVMIGGTTVNEKAWAERSSRRRQMPVFIAHGRWDGVLPFAIAERFARTLASAGLDVTWVPFDGGHDIPSVVIRELNVFLRELERDSVARTGSLEP